MKHMRLPLASLAVVAVLVTACTSGNAEDDLSNADEEIVVSEALDCAALGDVGVAEAVELTLEDLRDEQTEVTSALNAVLNDPKSSSALDEGAALLLLPTDTATASSSRQLTPADLIVPWFVTAGELVSAQEVAALSGNVLAATAGTPAEIGAAPVLCDGYAFADGISVAVLSDIPEVLPPVAPLTAADERSFIGQSGPKCSQFEEQFADIRDLDLQGALQALDVAATDPSDVPVGPVTVVAVSGVATDLTSSVSDGEQLTSALVADEQIVFTDGSNEPVTEDIVGLKVTIGDNEVGCSNILFADGVIHLL
jgi:hypothetical protein